jgi:hypothetical protein
MNRTEPWCLCESGVVLQRDVDGTSELLWINPQLLPPKERTAHPLRVEVLCWFEDLTVLNAGLCVLGDFFRHDSVLTAVSRRDDSTRVLLYTATWETVVTERCLAVRAVLRPTAMGLRAAREPGWDSFEAVLSTTGVTPLVRGTTVE